MAARVLVGVVADDRDVRERHHRPAGRPVRSLPRPRRSPCARRRSVSGARRRTRRGPCGRRRSALVARPSAAGRGPARPKRSLIRRSQPRSRRSRRRRRHSRKYALGGLLLEIRLTDEHRIRTPAEQNGRARAKASMVSKRHRKRCRGRTSSGRRRQRRLRQREDDRVDGGVVRLVGLARHRRHVDGDVVCDANGTWPRLLERQRLLLAGLITSSVCVFVIGPPCAVGRSIVSVTGICTSCESPLL